jgi:hypothetical protein
MRYSDTDDENEIVTLSGTWAPDAPRARVFVNFGHLRLLRPERVHFRLDHRVGRGKWQQGASAFVDMTQVRLTEEQLAELGQLRGHVRGGTDGPE